MIIERDFLDHWKTQRLIRVLEDPSAPFCLLRLWGHCEARKDDILPIDADALACICRYEGDSKKFLRAMIDAKWLKRISGGFEVHGWRERNARLLANIENGKKGGRPRVNKVSSGLNEHQPKANPQEPMGFNGLTQSEPKANPQEPDKRREDKRSGELPPTAPQGGQESEFAASPSEPVAETAKKRVCRILGRNPSRPLPFEAMAELGRLCPIPEEEFELIEWFYGLPDGDPKEDPELSWRRKDFNKLILHWTEEVDRSRAYREKNGGAKKEAEKKEAPADWQKIAKALWPTAELPEDFWKLSSDVQREIQQHKQSEEK